MALQSKTLAINAEALENDALEVVKPIIKSYIDTVLFNHIYHAKVSKEQEAKTAADLKEYRAKFWNKALTEAKGDKKKACEIYTKNLE